MIFSFSLYGTTECVSEIQNVSSSSRGVLTMFDPLVWQGEGQFVCPAESTLAQTCLCLTPLHVNGTHPNLCAR